ncbi:MAG: hypothetical protein LBL46_00610, partial [Rickettsiales bacterium]|nr:hypothetical protein [Rickettsiales bacterium]
MKNQDAFLAGYSELKIPIIDSAGVPAWPEMFSAAKIERLREVVGPRHFASQMMLDATPMTRARLDASAIQFYSDDFDWRTARLGDNLINGWGFY